MLAAKTLLLALVSVSGMSESGLTVQKSMDKTAEDAPLEFQLQRAGSGEYGGFSIWGVVQNPTDDSYENVTVIISVFDGKGKFIGRGRGSASPGKIGKGQVGYVDELSIDIGNRVPAKVEWKVIVSEF